MIDETKAETIADDDFFCPEYTTSKITLGNLRKNIENNEQVYSKDATKASLNDLAKDCNAVSEDPWLYPPHTVRFIKYQARLFEAHFSKPNETIDDDNRDSMSGYISITNNFEERKKAYLSALRKLLDVSLQLAALSGVILSAGAQAKELFREGLIGMTMALLHISILFLKLFKRSRLVWVPVFVVSGGSLGKTLMEMYLTILGARAIALSPTKPIAICGGVSLGFTALRYTVNENLTDKKEWTTQFLINLYVQSLLVLPISVVSRRAKVNKNLFNAAVAHLVTFGLCYTGFFVIMGFRKKDSTFFALLFLVSMLLSVCTALLSVILPIWALSESDAREHSATAVSAGIMLVGTVLLFMLVYSRWNNLLDAINDTLNKN